MEEIFETAINQFKNREGSSNQLLEIVALLAQAEDIEVARSLYPETSKSAARKYLKNNTFHKHSSIHKIHLFCTIGEMDFESVKRIREISRTQTEASGEELRELWQKIKECEGLENVNLRDVFFEETLPKAFSSITDLGFAELTSIDNRITKTATTTKCIEAMIERMTIDELRALFSFEGLKEEEYRRGVSYASKEEYWICSQWLSKKVQQCIYSSFSFDEILKMLNYEEAIGAWMKGFLTHMRSTGASAQQVGAAIARLAANPKIEDDEVAWMLTCNRRGVYGLHVSCHALEAYINSGKGNEEIQIHAMQNIFFRLKNYSVPWFKRLVETHELSLDRISPATICLDDAKALDFLRWSIALGARRNSWEGPAKILHRTMASKFVSDKASCIALRETLELGVPKRQIEQASQNSRFFGSNKPETEALLESIFEGEAFLVNMKVRRTILTLRGILGLEHGE